MDDWLKREHLIQTERRVAQGEGIIAEQRAVVTGLEHAGRERSACTWPTASDCVRNSAASPALGTTAKMGRASIQILWRLRHNTGLVH
jgi:hypothetical protein